MYRILCLIVFLLCNENLNSFLTRVGKVFKGGKYSREETRYMRKYGRLNSESIYLVTDYGHPMEV